MIYGSLCSGIEAATQAWHPLGWKPAFFSEIEKFPSAVLAHHYPDVPNHGDMTKFEDWPDHAIDLLVGGTPCQSFSVAGLRKGLADPRGNLMLTFGAVAQRYKPRWIVWENVPGVLSSDGGRDFGTFLGMLAELGYGFAYRVLDAQYVRVGRFTRAVPQRRRRVFVVGYLGDWRRAAAVLFDGESLSWNSAPRRQEGERIAPTISARPTGGGGLGADFDLDGGLIAADVAPTLNAHFGDKQGLEDQHINGGGDCSLPPVSLCLNAGGMGRIDAESETLIPTIGGVFDVAHSLRGEGFDASEDGTGRGVPLVPVAYRTAGDGAVYDEGDVTAPLTTGTDRNAQVVAFSVKDHGGDAMDDCSPTLRAGGFADSHQNGGVMPAVAFDLRGRDGGSMMEGPHDTANIRAASGGSSRSYIAAPWAVRRLTPKEAERLQAFPDGFTRIPYRGKPADKCPDGPRYKALGNSMAVNVMTWIGERIQLVEAI